MLFVSFILIVLVPAALFLAAFFLLLGIKVRQHLRFFGVFVFLVAPMFFVTLNMPLLPVPFIIGSILLSVLLLGTLLLGIKVGQPLRFFGVFVCLVAFIFVVAFGSLDGQEISLTALILAFTIPSFLITILLLGSKGGEVNPLRFFGVFVWLVVFMVFVMTTALMVWIPIISMGI